MAINHTNPTNNAVPPPSIKNILVNGTAQPTNAENLADLLAAMGISSDMPGIAVARNGAVAPRINWSHHAINDRDEIEIIRPNVGG